MQGSEPCHTFEVNCPAHTAPCISIWGDHDGGYWRCRSACCVHSRMHQQEQHLRARLGVNADPVLVERCSNVLP